MVRPGTIRHNIVAMRIFQFRERKKRGRRRRIKEERQMEMATAVSLLLVVYIYMATACSLCRAVDEPRFQAVCSDAACRMRSDGGKT